MGYKLISQFPIVLQTFRQLDNSLQALPNPPDFTITGNLGVIFHYVGMIFIRFVLRTFECSFIIHGVLPDYFSPLSHIAWNIEMSDIEGVALTNTRPPGQGLGVGSDVLQFLLCILSPEANP